MIPYVEILGTMHLGLTLCLNVLPQRAKSVQMPILPPTLLDVRGAVQAKMDEMHIRGMAARKGSNPRLPRFNSPAAGGAGMVYMAGTSAAHKLHNEILHLRKAKAQLASQLKASKQAQAVGIQKVRMRTNTHMHAHSLQCEACYLICLQREACYLIRCSTLQAELLEEENQLLVNLLRDHLPAQHRHLLAEAPTRNNTNSYSASVTASPQPLPSHHSTQGRHTAASQSSRDAKISSPAGSAAPVALANVAGSKASSSGSGGGSSKHSAAWSKRGGVSDLLRQVARAQKAADALARESLGAPSSGKPGSVASHASLREPNAKPAASHWLHEPPQHRSSASSMAEGDGQGAAARISDCSSQASSWAHDMPTEGTVAPDRSGSSADASIHVPSSGAAADTGHGADPLTSANRYAGQATSRSSRSQGGACRSMSTGRSSLAQSNSGSATRRAPAGLTIRTSSSSRPGSVTARPPVSVGTSARLSTASAVSVLQANPGSNSSRGERINSAQRLALLAAMRAEHSAEVHARGSTASEESTVHSNAPSLRGLPQTPGERSAAESEVSNILKGMVRDISRTDINSTGSEEEPGSCTGSATAEAADGGASTAAKADENLASVLSDNMHWLVSDVSALATAQLRQSWSPLRAHTVAATLSRSNTASGRTSGCYCPALSSERSPGRQSASSASEFGAQYAASLQLQSPVRKRVI